MRNYISKVLKYGLPTEKARGCQNTMKLTVGNYFKFF